MKFPILCTLFFVGSVISSCSTSRVIKPLAKGEQQISASLGGPLIKFGGLIIPIPYTSIAYARGIDSNLSVFGGLHTTSLLFGNLQTDIGATYQICKQKNKIPAFTVSPVLNTIYGFSASKLKLYPELNLNTYWEYGKKRKNLVYASVSNWFVLNKSKAYQQPQKARWIPSFIIGNTWNKTKWAYTIEMRLLAPSYSNQKLVVDYATPMNNGAFGLYFGLTRKF